MYKKRYILKLFGIVQGVGFRPFVYKLAKEKDIKGWVKNDGGAVIIDFEGDKKNIKFFLLTILNKPPKLSRIEKYSLKALKNKGYKDFQIIKSSFKNNILFLSPDISICDKCREEIFDKDSNYYRYPFTNCTDCGPRYTIIKSLPYDRKNTTMEYFKMCSFCKGEYENPLSRRFHAQPNCCKECGPRIELIDKFNKKIEATDIIKHTIDLIKSGKIIAIKGIGGFHLVCDPKNEKVIKLLRKRKKRPDKPFAIMAKNIKKVKDICNVTRKEELVLLSEKKPIVLLKKKDKKLISEDVSKNKYLGVMLPYTPLHLLLFEYIDYLVMTSGNLNGHPMEYKNEDAIKNLKNIVDFYLIHNREINMSVDDSVVKVFNNKEMVTRQGRGYSPKIIKFNESKEILALGALEKSSISFCKNNYAYISQYLGDIKNLDTYLEYEKTVNDFLNIFKGNPEIIAYDLHSNYSLTKLSKKYTAKKIPIQHHHAHMASCMGEHNLYKKCIGVIYDGTGLGLDKNIWGGEFFIGDRLEFKRVGHLENVLIQGGEKAIKEPWRIALSYIHSVGYKNIDVIDRKIEEKKLVLNALENNINCFNTSSMGRLFDCVSAILGLRYEITYNGQGAIELENIIDEDIKETYNYLISYDKGIILIDYKQIILQVLKDKKSGVNLGEISTKFHNTIIKFTIDTVIKISKDNNLDNVIISGGVFQNNYLLKNIYEKLSKEGFNVFYNEKIPINDNGISFGQLVIANRIVNGG
ncbi:MAG: carbamoyltransferase HypF [Firmicutes bacterium]|nr:carbamoyltransferase HypF [Bacillota bacterium]